MVPAHHRPPRPTTGPPPRPSVARALGRGPGRRQPVPPGGAPWRGGQPLAPNTTPHAGAPRHHNTSPATAPPGQPAQRPQAHSPGPGVPHASADAAALPTSHRTGPPRLILWPEAIPFLRPAAPPPGPAGQAVG